MNKLYSLLILFLVTVTLTNAQPGTLDPTFGTDGVVTTAISPKYNNVSTTIVQADGKILVAGDAGTPSTYQMTIARYNTNGSLVRLSVMPELYASM